MDVAKATEQLAGYAAHDKQAALQACVLSLNLAVNMKIREVISGKQLEDIPAEIISIMAPLLSTTQGLTMRPVALPSAMTTARRAGATSLRARPAPTRTPRRRRLVCRP